MLTGLAVPDDAQLPDDAELPAYLYRELEMDDELLVRWSFNDNTYDPETGFTDPTAQSTAPVGCCMCDSCSDLRSKAISCSAFPDGPCVYVHNAVGSDAEVH